MPPQSIFIWQPVLLGLTAPKRGIGAHDGRNFCKGGAELALDERGGALDERGGV